MPRPLLSLLLGLLLTLASTWLAPAALYHLLPFHWHLFDGPSNNTNYSVLWSTTAIRTLTFSEGTDPLWGLSAPRANPPYWFTPPQHPSPTLREETEASGFPFRALLCRTGYTITTPAAAPTFQYIHGGLQLRPNAERFRVLPLTPIWPGLLADLALWSTISYLILITIQTLRTRRAQKRKHLCPKCNYDRTGLPAKSPCPECGHPLPTSHI